MRVDDLTENQKKLYKAFKEFNVGNYNKYLPSRDSKKIGVKLLYSYIELLKVKEKQSGLLWKVITHPDATDEQICDAALKLNKSAKDMHRHSKDIEKAFYFAHARHISEFVPQNIVKHCIHRRR